MSSVARGNTRGCIAAPSSSEALKSGHGDLVHDMEQCLGKLDPLAKKLIARIVFEEFRHDEVAKELRITRRQVIRRMHQAVDRVTELLLEAELLEPFCAPDGLPLKKSPMSVGKTALRAMEGDW